MLLHCALYHHPKQANMFPCKAGTIHRWKQIPTVLDKSIRLHGTQQRRISHLACASTFSWVHTENKRNIWLGWLVFLSRSASTYHFNHRCWQTSALSDLVPSQLLYSSQGGEEGCVDWGAYNSNFWDFSESKTNYRQFCQPRQWKLSFRDNEVQCSSASNIESYNCLGWKGLLKFS